jgi:hypothetical protein
MLPNIRYKHILQSHKVQGKMKEKMETRKKYGIRNSWNQAWYMGTITKTKGRIESDGYKKVVASLNYSNVRERERERERGIRVSLSLKI